MNKKKFFLILLFSILLGNIYLIRAKAETANFYEAEYIDGIYMNKFSYNKQTLYYQKARFFRKQGSNEFAYCIEPFRFFDGNSTYESTININNITKERLDRISKIAHFGYGYKNHTDLKWYAISQMMIWEAADSSGDYYFTNTLNGQRITPYQNEINEINNLISLYDRKPSIDNKTYTIVEGESLILEDNNNVIQNYQSNNNNIKIENNQVIVSPLKEGNYSINLFKQDNIYNKPYIFYQSNNSQNLIETGNLNDIKASFNIKVLKTKIELSKIDKDTKTTTPSGEASLNGAVYTLYDSNNNIIEELTINDNQAVINNISFGKYYLKEEKAGEGYTVDNETYEINITPENPSIELILENKVIEKKIIIEKKYGEDNSFKNEKNISFSIFQKDNYLKTITTNEDGIAEITLPYGEYKLFQDNSTEGYTKVEPLTIKVTDTEDELIELKDLKIPVPNTHIDKNIFQIIFEILLLL